MGEFHEKIDACQINLAIAWFAYLARCPGDEPLPNKRAESAARLSVSHELSTISSQHTSTSTGCHWVP